MAQSAKGMIFLSALEISMTSLDASFANVAMSCPPLMPKPMQRPRTSTEVDKSRRMMYMVLCHIRKEDAIWEMSEID